MELCFALSQLQRLVVFLLCLRPSTKKKQRVTTNQNNPLQATSIRSIRALAPLMDRVLVQRIKAETKTASGIFLPESSVEKLNEAKVIAVGPGAFDKQGNRMPMGVANGDRVLIPQVRMKQLTADDKKVANGGISSLVALPSRLVMRSTSCSATASKCPPLMNATRGGKLRLTLRV